MAIRAIVTSIGIREMMQSLRNISQYDEAAAVVGPEAGKTHPRTGTPLSDVGAINEFGAPSKNIPKRPFLRPTINEKKQPLVKELQNAAERGDRAREAFDKVGAKAVEIVKETITQLSSPANAPSTVDRKGFNDPLVETGSLRDSIKHEVKR